MRPRPRARDSAHARSSRVRLSAFAARAPTSALPLADVEPLRRALAQYDADRRQVEERHSYTYCWDAVRGCSMRERRCVRLLFTQCCSHARILPQKPHVDDDARTRATHLALSAPLLALASLAHYTRLVRTDMSPCVPLASGPCVRVGDCGDYPPNPTFHEARCSSMQRLRTCASACACRSPRQQGTRWPRASSDRGQSTP